MIKTWIKFLFNLFIRKRPLGWSQALGGQLSSTVCSERTPYCSHGWAGKLKSEQLAAPPACTEGCGYSQCDLQNPTLLNDRSHLLVSFFFLSFYCRDL